MAGPSLARGPFLPGTTILVVLAACVSAARGATAAPVPARLRAVGLSWLARVELSLASADELAQLGLPLVPPVPGGVEVLLDLLEPGGVELSDSLLETLEPGERFVACFAAGGLLLT